MTYRPDRPTYEANPHCPYCLGTALTTDEHGRPYICRCTRRNASDDHRTGCTCYSCSRSWRT